MEEKKIEIKEESKREVMDEIVRILKTLQINDVKAIRAFARGFTR